MVLDVSGERGPAYQAGALAFFLASVSILGALGFEYIGRLAPCPLCVQERYAYYFAMPVLFLALSLLSGGNRSAAKWLFALVALAFLANAGLGVFHAGAEWKFWPGPDTCGTDQGVTATAGGLLQDLETIKVVRCDEAAIRILGLSLAGWNVVVSMLIFTLSLRAAFAAAEPR